ncbi:MAG: tRNA-dihydrouridine synthase family protein [Muribaculaceae bacterium]|nr:tRNA-dihydrouridine synthase family protein [Muribaculaceae bacterium]
MNKASVMLLAAPLQGYTEAPWRHYHSALYGASAPLIYYTPFVRVEGGCVRARDLRDATSPLLPGTTLVQQILPADGAEAELLTGTLADAGAKCIDINMGCPFAPQVKRGRGAGLIGRRSELAAIARVMERYAAQGISFSVKMRLGVNESTEWPGIADILAEMPLSRIVLHPRTAAQQYGGTPDFDEAARFIEASAHPVVINGDICSPADIDTMLQRFPTLAGVMVGRGLLMRPSLMAEWRESAEWSVQRRRSTLLELHDSILSHYSSTLCGDAQVLSKIKPLWEYFGCNFERRLVKKIVKAKHLEAYRAAVAELRNNM